MKNGIGWAAAGLGTLLCLACCLPAVAAVGGAVAALALGFVAAQATGALVAVALVAVVTIVVATSRMRRRAERLVWREPAANNKAA